MNTFKADAEQGLVDLLDQVSILASMAAVHLPPCRQDRSTTKVYRDVT